MHRPAPDHGRRTIDRASDPDTARQVGRLLRVLLVGGPLALLAVVVGLALVIDPVGTLWGDDAEVVPAEELSVESVRLSPGRIEATVRNVSSVSITLAQVQVNEAYWDHAVPDRHLARFETASVSISYPWDEGLPLHLAFLTSTGSRIDHEIPIAVATPSRDAASVGRHAWLGFLIGVVPVAIGLLWYPALRVVSRRTRARATAFTAGLLLLLFVGTVREGLEAAGDAGTALNAVGMMVLGAVAMVSIIVLVQESLPSTSLRGRPAPTAMTSAYILALAIGMHNLGEGLAVSTAVAAGEVALGTSLLLGFIVHNSTEGFAIALPVIALPRFRVAHFLGLTLVAGAPAMLGTVIGSWAVAPLWVALAFGAAAGALVQVLWALGRDLLSDPAVRGRTIAGGLSLGLAVMYLTGLLTA